MKMEVANGRELLGAVGTLPHPHPPHHQLPPPPPAAVVVKRE